MRQTLFALVLCLLLAIPLQLSVCGQEAKTSDNTIGTRATEVAGDIDTDTTWSGQVTVMGEVDVLEGVKLTISPGTTVTFHFEGEPGWDDGYELHVDGTIKAVGTSSSKITFTSDSININPDKVGAWAGIYIDETAGTDCAFEWCNFSYASDAIEMYKSNASIKNCEFFNVIDECIDLTNSDSIIDNNIFSFGIGYTPHAISCYSSSKPSIRYNTFYLNEADGILTMATSAPLISENEFYGGQTGVSISGDSQPDMTRCRFFGQSSSAITFNLESSPKPVYISQCLMTGGINCGVMSISYSELKLDTCEISAFTNYGIFIDTESGVPVPQLINCNIYGNGIAQIYDSTTNEYEVKGCYVGHQAPFSYIIGSVISGDATSNIVIKEALDKPVDLPSIEQFPVVMILNKAYMFNTTYDVIGIAVDPDQSDSISKVEVSIVKNNYPPEYWKTADGNVNWRYTIKASELQNGEKYDFYVRCQTLDGEKSLLQKFTFSSYIAPGSDDDVADDDTSDDDDSDGRHPILSPSIQNYWTWMELTAFIITLLLGVIGFFMLRSKKRRVKKAMKDIDNLAKAAPTNPQMAESELIKLHKQIKYQYEKGRLEDQHFLILERYLGQALTEVQRLLRQKGLPVTPLTMQLDPMKPETKKGPAPPPPAGAPPQGHKGPVPPPPMD